MNRRAEVLQELVRFDKPTEPLLRELGSFGWDWTEAPLLVLKKEALLRVVDPRFGSKHGHKKHKKLKTRKLMVFLQLKRLTSTVSVQGKK